MCTNALLFLPRSERPKKNPNEFTRTTKTWPDERNVSIWLIILNVNIILILWYFIHITRIVQVCAISLRLLVTFGDWNWKLGLANWCGTSKSFMNCLFLLTRFSTKILVIRLANGGRSGGRILNGVKLWFPLNNLFALAYSHQTCCIGSLYQEAAWDCYLGVCDQGQGHCY